MHIGSNTVIGAGSVVTKDIPEVIGDDFLWDLLYNRKKQNKGRDVICRYRADLRLLSMFL